MEERKKVAEEGETLSEIKEHGKAVGKYYERLRENVKFLIHGDQHSLLLYSPAGYGKSFQVESVLEEEGYEFMDDYMVQQGYSTPLSFYKTLYYNRDKVIVLDDIEGIIHDKKALSLLKACTWNVSDERTVTWKSTTHRLDEVPRQFQFSGKVIICMNRKPSEKNQDYQALKSRSIYHELDVGFKELIDGIFPTIAKNKLPEEKAEEIVEFVKDNSNPASEIEIRDLIKSIHAYKYAEEFDKDWKMLVEGILESDPDLNVVWRLMREEKPVKKKIKEFREETGKSRRTYYNYREKLKRILNEK